jgi:hypothetical protein
VARAWADPAYNRVDAKVADNDAYRELQRRRNCTIADQQLAWTERFHKRLRNPTDIHRPPVSNAVSHARYKPLDAPALANHGS